MAYTPTQLEEYSAKKLIAIILDLQNEITNLKEKTSIYDKICQLIPPGHITEGEVRRRGGRPALSPEERVASYERQKEKQRQRYKEMQASRGVVYTPREDK